MCLAGFRIRAECQWPSWVHGVPAGMGMRPRGFLQGSWQRKEYRSSAVWRGALMEWRTKARWKQGGDTFAVLGSGVDVCYPAGHRKLYDRLIRTGGILSEQPPGMPPKPGHFPARNRIISGLSDLVLVVEAREQSGSLITADLALEQGKDVFAVPGRIGDGLSRGCLNLIRQGAGLADSPRAILDALGMSAVKNTEPGKILLAKDENIVYSWIRLQPVSLDEIVKNTKMPVQKVLSLLVGLELKGCIREIRKNDYVRTD